VPDQLGRAAADKGEGLFHPDVRLLEVHCQPQNAFFFKFGALNPDFTPIYIRLKTKIIAGKHEFPHLFCVEVNTFGVYPKP